MAVSVRALLLAALIAAADLFQPLAAAGNKLESEDASLLKDLAQANIAEVLGGSAALERTKNPKLKAFAQIMVDEHSKILLEIRSLASARGLRLPEGPNANHRKVLGELKTLNGEGFDRRYLRQIGVADLESTEKLLKRTEQSSDDAELKALATKLLPLVQQHFKHAEDLARSLN